MTDGKWPCEICGTYSRRTSEMEDDLGFCPKEDAEPDPDILREDRDERRRIERRGP